MIINQIFKNLADNLDKNGFFDPDSGEIDTIALLSALEQPYKSDEQILLERRMAENRRHKQRIADQKAYEEYEAKRKERNEKAKKDALHKSRSSWEQQRYTSKLETEKRRKKKKDAKKTRKKR